MNKTISKIIIDDVEVENVPEDLKLKDLMRIIETAKDKLSGASCQSTWAWYPLEMFVDEEKERLLKEFGCRMDSEGKGVWCPPQGVETGGIIKLGWKKYRFEVSLNYKTGKYLIEIYNGK
jgi:hypothetical protein